MSSTARRTPSRGAKPEKLMRDALMVALKREAEGADGKPTKRLALLADRIIEKGLAGDVQAWKEIRDTVDGRPAQAIVGGDQDDAPIEIQIIRFADISDDASEQ